MYLGEVLPKYVALNIRMVQSRFSSHEVVLLVDSQKLYDECNAKNLPAELIESPKTSWKPVKDSISYSADFRDDFWFRTVARFDALRSYLKMYPNEEILHIEADVLLTPTFPMSFFANNHKFGIAYPITNRDQGVASTFYIKELKALEHFLEYCEKCFLENSTSTDVSILGSYYQDFPERCLVLPTSPSETFDFNSHVDYSLKQTMSEHFKITNGLFDASTWGQFLTGHDPKNSVGFTPIFLNQNHHAIRTNRVTFRISTDSRVFVSLGGNETEIFSLHVHSKNEILFDSTRSTRFLTHLVSMQNGKVKYRFNLGLFIKLMPGYLKYRARLSAKKLLKHDT